MNYPFLILGLMSLIGGFLLSAFINKRRFNRRNAAGLQQFSSYEKSVFITFIERLGKIIALILIALGLFIIAGTYIGKVEKERSEKKRQGRSAN